MNAAKVTASAALMRIFPIVVGVVIARVAGTRDYADFVLSLSLLNVFASFLQLSVVPQLIRSIPQTERGDFAGLIAFGATWLFVPVVMVILGIEW